MTVSIALTFTAWIRCGEKVSNEPNIGFKNNVRIFYIKYKSEFDEGRKNLFQICQTKT